MGIKFAEYDNKSWYKKGTSTHKCCQIIINTFYNVRISTDRRPINPSALKAHIFHLLAPVAAQLSNSQ